MKTLLAFFALCLFPAAALAQAEPPDEDMQSWNEVELQTRLSKWAEATLVGESRLERNVRDLSSSRFGAAVTFDVGRHLSLTPDYFYVADHSPVGRTNYSHRLRFAATLKAPLWRFDFRNRNLFERRIRHSRTDFTRYRNRLTVEFPLGRKRSRLDPFVANEVFYDFSDKEWMRNRFSVGAGRRFGERLAGEVYYLLQNERDERPGTVHVIGTGLRIDLN